MMYATVASPEAIVERVPALLYTKLPALLAALLKALVTSLTQAPGSNSPHPSPEGSVPLSGFPYT